MLDNLETIDVEAYLALSSYKPKEEDIHDQWNYPHDWWTDRRVCI
jgi:hypothetical protein